MSLLSQCVNLSTLVLTGNKEVTLDSLQTIVEALPELRVVDVTVNHSKKITMDYGDHIKWPSQMESLSIKIDNKYYSFNIPKNLVHFELTYNEPEPVYHCIIIANYEDLFTEKLKSCNVFGVSANAKCVEKMSECCPNLEVNKRCFCEC